ncbi:zinc-binding protein [Oscillospiraceae bacterium MB08-C2-2]|nr:zinc-binding protein [Oscillospiraceae bacterium MB08-C2-2]
MKETILICCKCGCELTEDTYQTFDGKVYCSRCIEKEAICCARCGELIANDGATVCDHCYDYHYTNCERCGTLVPNEDVYYTEDDDDNDYPYCQTCYDRHEKNIYLHSYSYKPEPIFYGEGTRFFGVELEIDDAGKDECNAQKLCELANSQRKRIYIKSDSSLDDGLEIVTHPMSLTYHMESMPWKVLLEQALSLGYKSHMAHTCGLHIHVDRTSFTDSYEYQEECIARVLYLVERFWEELLRFSRRTQSQLKRWANRYGYKEKPNDILDVNGGLNLQ